MTKEARIRQYLLGALAQDERRDLEDQYFSDTETFDELVAIENDLIDSYVRQELSSFEGEQFETQYLNSPRRKDRLEFARSIDRACRESFVTASTRRPFSSRFGIHVFSKAYPILQWASVAAALILAAAGSWLIFQNYQLRMQLQEARKQSLSVQAQVGHQQEQPRPQGPTLDLHDASRSQTPPNTDVATLEPSTQPALIFTPSSGVERGAERSQKALAIPPNVSSVILRLPLSRDTYVKYQAELQTVEGRTIQTTKGLTSRKSSGQAVVLFRVLSKRLATGDYVVMLSGTDADGKVEDVEAYSFRTVDK